jgi:hypothetical protein
MQVTTLLFDAPIDPAALPVAWDSPRTLVLAFGAREGVGAEDIAALTSAFPHSIVFGCSTAGEINDRRLYDRTVSVAVARFEATELAWAAADVPGVEDSQAAGRLVAAQLARPGLAGVFVLSDGLHVNGSALVRGLNEVLPPGVVVTGGLAGDGPRFAQTWVIRDGRPADHVVAAVGFTGAACRLGYGSKGGWDLFGPERLVTGAAGNVVYEIDGKPALELYKTYLGALAEGLPATALLFPLSLRPTVAGDDRVVRTVLAVDERAHSMTFAGEVPQGSYVQLMRANADRLVQGASQAGYLGQAPHAPDAPTLAIAVSCVGRRLVLGERAEEEIEATLEALPASTRQVGFYSYGELSPHRNGACDLHNQTMTLTTISEAA